MDPLSALIGGGLGIAGGLMSSSSAQAINQLNIANQQAMASGAYLPQLISNAQKSGINPLAVLGIHTPSAGMAVPTDPGSGVRAAGAAVAQINPRQKELEQIAVDRGKADVAALHAQINNTNIEAARNEYVLNQLRLHPELMGPGVSEPASSTSFPIPQINWLGQLAHTITGPYRIPGGSWSPNLSLPTYDPSVWGGG